MEAHLSPILSISLANDQCFRDHWKQEKQILSLNFTVMIAFLMKKQKKWILSMYDVDCSKKVPPVHIFLFERVTKQHSRDEEVKIKQRAFSTCKMFRYLEYYLFVIET